MSMDAFAPVRVVVVVASGSVIVTMRLKVVSVGIFTTKEPAISKL